MKSISNTSMEADICVEVHHGRKGKNMGTKFKGVVRGVLISTLITASILSTTAVPALAANDSSFLNEANEVVSVYGVSFEEALSVVTNNINNIIDMKKNGTITQAALDELAINISKLERSVNKTDFSQVMAVSNVLDTAETVVQGINGNSKVLAAVAVARQSLGIEKDELNVNQAMAPSDVKSFDDVIEGQDWAYKTVMRAVELGLFEGTRAVDANGVGHFDPDRQMTRAEFITVCLRAAKIDKTTYNGNGEWYAGYWDAAVKQGIINKSDFGGLSGMSSPCTRAEMSYIAVETLAYRGEKPTELVDTNRIADYDSITDYRNYVLKAYSMGILMGVDNIGTFNPSGTLTRAQAATVCVRLLDKSFRAEVDFSPVEKPQSTAQQTWREGEKHIQPHEGDIVIKEDGTQVVLKSVWIGDFQILGFGQGVDIYAGWLQGTVTPSGEYSYGSIYGQGELYNPIDGTPITKGANGEAHSASEWSMAMDYIEEIGYPRPTTPGAYDGEIRNTFWRWVAEEDMWCRNMYAF